jgi:hypothetical protein
MRLREIQTIINTNLSRCEPTAAQGKMLDNTSGLTLMGLARSRACLEALGEVPQLAGLVKPLLATPFLMHHLEPVVVPSEVWSAFMSRVNTLKDRATMIKELIDQALPPQNPLSITIEIPPPESLTDLKDLIEDIDLIFARIAGNDYKPAVLVTAPGSRRCVAITRSGFTMLIAAAPTRRLAS